MPEQTFFPYRTLRTPLEITVDGLEIDGGIVELSKFLDVEHRTLDLSELQNWDECALTVTSTVTESLDDVLMADESVDATDTLFLLDCSQSRRRFSSAGIRSSGDDSYTTVITLKRNDVFGFCLLNSVLVRATDASEPTADVATTRGQRLAESERWHIYVDDKDVLPGGDLTIKWMSFHEIPKLKEARDCLYFLDLGDDEHPTLFLNQDFHDFKKLMMNKGRTGRAPRIRDVLATSILQKVLTDLVVFALTAKEDIAIDDLDGWRKGLLHTLSARMYPNKTSDEAFSRAFDVGTQEHTKSEFFGQLGIAVQRHLEIEKHASSLISLAAEGAP